MVSKLGEKIFLEILESYSNLHGESARALEIKWKCKLLPKWERGVLARRFIKYGFIKYDSKRVNKPMLYDFGKINTENIKKYLIKFGY